LKIPVDQKGVYDVIILADLEASMWGAARCLHILASRKALW